MPKLLHDQLGGNPLLPHRGEGEHGLRDSRGRWELTDVGTSARSRLTPPTSFCYNEHERPIPKEDKSRMEKDNPRLAISRHHRLEQAIRENLRELGYDK